MTSKKFDGEEVELCLNSILLLYGSYLTTEDIAIIRKLRKIAFELGIAPQLNVF